jgi:hypothetical protein
LSDAIKKAGTSRFPSSYETDRFVQELLESGKATGSAFTRLAASVVESLVRILQLTNAESVRYLGPLANVYSEQGHLDIATLNYDLAIEALGELLGVGVDDGMASWDKKGRLDFEPGIRLLKLHGSIGWETTGVNPSAGDPFIPVERIQRVSGKVPSRPAVIFGAGNKLRASGPYLDLLRLFNESLDDSDSLLVVGYSFRDEHVNALLTNWLNADRSRRLVILDPSQDRFGPQIQYAQRGLATQLAILANGHPIRVQRIQQTTAAGLATAIEAARSDVPVESEPRADS